MDFLIIVCNLVFLLVFAAFDLFNRRVIPNYLTIAYVLLSVASLFFRQNLLPYVLGFVEFCLVLLVVWVYSKFRGIKLFNAIGGADVKVFLGLSINSGVFVFNFAILISSFLGIAFGVIFKKRRIPLFPFLFFGYLFAVTFLFLEERF